MAKAKVVNIFVAHPADTKEEFLALEQAVEVCRSSLAFSKTGVTPQRMGQKYSGGLHPNGGQGQIEEYADITNCDVVVGLIKNRIGHIGRDGSSDTQKEIRAAIESWRVTGKPIVMVYFASELQDESDEKQVRIRGEFKRELQPAVLLKTMGIRRI